MTIINVNSISGINSITAQGASGIEFYDSSGNSLQTVAGDGLTVGTGATIGGSTNVITASTNGEERVRIDSSGNVGINRADPNQKLNVSGNIEVNAYDSANAQGGYYTAKGLIIGNAYDAGKTTTTDDRNGIIWQERGLDLDIATSDILRMKITYDGKVGIGTDIPTTKLSIGAGFDTASSDGYGVGNKITEVANNNTGCIQLQASGFNNAYYPVLEIYNGSTRTAHFKADGNLVLQSGSGIDFSATGDGSGVDSSELLDDYEEGAWSPTVTYGGTSASGTATGKYTKIGNLVHITFQVQITNLNGGTGDIRMGSLPYAVSQSPTYSHGNVQGNSQQSLPSGAGSIMPYIENSTSNARFLYMTTGGHADITHAHFPSGVTFYGFGLYYTA